MQGYGVWLAEEKGRLEGPGSVGDYTWAAADTDFVEWIFGLQAVGAIRYKGQPADINHLVKWGRWALNQDVANIHELPVEACKDGDAGFAGFFCARCRQCPL